MGREMASQSWFASFWKTSWKSAQTPEKAVIGILGFEVATLMSKLVNLWYCLGDEEVARLRVEMANSFGVRKLVSDDDDLLIYLVLDEIVENLIYVIKTVVRFAKKCTDPVLRQLEHLFDDPMESVVLWSGWEYRGKKMERKVKKMERFIGVTSQLYQEQEVLAELEQTLRTMQHNADIDRVKVLEFQQKVMWQRQEVKSLRYMSPWIRTYDYIVRLLSRSVFTILKRINHVFDITQKASSGEDTISGHANAVHLARNRSFAAHMRALVHPSESNPGGFYGRPVGRSLSKFGKTDDRNGIFRKNQPSHLRSSSLLGMNSDLVNKRLTHVGPFKGCMMDRGNCSILESCKPVSSSMRLNNTQSDIIGKMSDTTQNTFLGDNQILNIFLLNFKFRLSDGTQSTLGDAALALRYANIIVLIEKLASSPHLIGHEERDDLYNLLPATVRAALKGRLKLYRRKTTSVYDAVLAGQWTLALSRILDWLAPLAYNTIRYQSEHNFEKHHLASRTTVFLVLTLYHANQAKTEAVVTELLMGLNYLCRFG